MAPSEAIKLTQNIIGQSGQLVSLVSQWSSFTVAAPVIIILKAIAQGDMEDKVPQKLKHSSQVSFTDFDCRNDQHFKISHNSPPYSSMFHGEGG